MSGRPTRPRNENPVRDPEPGGQPGQPAVLGVAAQAAHRRAARDDELRTRHVRHRPDDRVEAVALDEAASGEHPRRGAAPDGRPIGPEGGNVHPARDDADPVRGHAQPGQLAFLVRGGGQDRGHVPGDRHLGTDAGLRAGVIRTLVPALDHAERVERLHDRHPVFAGAVQSGQPAHPEVRVHHVGCVPDPVGGQVTAKRRHVRQQLVLGQHLGGARWHLHHGHAPAHPDPVPGRAAVAPGVHRHLMPLSGERPGQLGHVHVLPAAVAATHGRERARVLRDKGNLHRVTPRERPWWATAAAGL